MAAVIHHGIDLATHRVGPGDQDHLVFVGRMSPDKGVAAAVRIARASGRPLRIVARICGPEEEDYFRSCVRPLLSKEDPPVEELGLEDRIEVVGRAAGLLNPIDWQEPFGLVMVESLATGTPVLARPEGAAPEIVDPGRTGFLFGSEEDGVRTVERLPGIDRAACRAAAESRFSRERMATDHAALYAAVLASPRSPPPRSRAVRGISALPRFRGVGLRS